MQKAGEALKKRPNLNLISTLVVAAILALTALLAFLSINGFDRHAAGQTQGALEEAIRKAAVQCYAIEGSYPPDIDYLAEHYGIVLNKDAYFYEYQTIGSNVMPDIAVIRK